MSETLKVGLSASQRDLLLRGLRYVRSSVLLDTREPKVDPEADRADELETINALVDQLNRAESTNQHASV